MKYIESGKYDWLFSILSRFHNKHYAVISNLLHYNISKLFTNYTNELLKHFKLIYILQDTPHFNYNPNNCLIQRIDKSLCYGILHSNASLVKYPIIYDKRLFYIDLNDYICNNGKCPFIYRGYPVYTDNNHLNLNFTYFLKDILFEKGFILEKVNHTTNVTCPTAIWCSKDSQNRMKTKSKCRND